MSELSDTDRAVMQHIKSQIQQLSGLPADGQLTQKDFEFLLFYIQDKTGEVLSLTTIKRIWRDEYRRLPHLSTLNMLAQLGCDQDWHAVKKQFLSPPATDHAPAPTPRNRTQAEARNWSRLYLSAGALMLVAVLGLTGYYVTRHAPYDTSRVQFSAVPTVQDRVPNSVVFSYDLTGIEADHFYIQQSWDPNKKVEVARHGRKQTDIYYEPGYHYAKLMAGGDVLKEIPVHIRHNGWFVRFRYPGSKLVRIPPAGLDTVGQLRPNDAYVSQVYKKESFQLGYMLSQEFNLPADNCQVEASLLFDRKAAPDCPTVNILVKGDRDYAWITLVNKGCESNLAFKVGDKHVSGKTEDLTTLGVNAFDWQHVTVKLHQGTFQVLVNNHIAYEGEYDNKLGTLKEVDYFFNGIGSLDDFKITDSNNNAFITQTFNP